MNDFNNMPMDAVAPMPDDGGKKSKYNAADYAPFGEHADYAFQEGWTPVVSSGGATTYKNKYSPAFDGVMINNKPVGRLEVVGNKNGLFNVHIRNSENGKIEQTIMSSQPFSQVDDYFRNQNSLIQQRVSRVQADPNTQQYNGIAWNQ